MDANRLIQHKFRIKAGDTLPLTGWHEATRQDLVDIFRELGYTRGAEIGVGQGTYSRILCQSIPGLKLMCVDPWTPYERITQDVCDERYQRAVERLTPFGAEIVRRTSLEAVRDVPEASLDFVYIDGRHEFDYVMMDIIEWSRRVRPGGIVSGHDFFYFYQSGVVDAVLAYTRAHNITTWYITKEKEASWLWVKR